MSLSFRRNAGPRARHVGKGLPVHRRVGPGGVIRARPARSSTPPETLLGAAAA
jgi:hypothetical protein